VSRSADAAPEPPPLSARYGAFAFAKRVVERLIRFYTVRQDAVNRNVEERLREVEEIPVTRRDGELQLRAQVSALSARLTHLQREVAHLRERLQRLEKTPE
jgi:polyhydroxyalkanoate synthesis regulator phasin